MAINHQAKLTSSELALLWNTYVTDTMSICMLSHFIEVHEDVDYTEILNHARQLSIEHVAFLSDLFKKEGIPIPQGFTEADYYKEAPRIYSDIFMIRYLCHMGRSGMGIYSLAKGTSSRKDVRAFFTNCLDESSRLFDMGVNLKLEKGIHVRSPIIAYPTEVDFVKKQGFLGAGFFSEKRPLLAGEIAHLATNIETNSIGATLLLGFGQTAKNKEVQDFAKRGFEISKKHVEIFSTILHDNNSPNPGSWDSTVSNSTVPAFSDKLMIFHMNMLLSVGIGNYGKALGNSMRTDIGAHYTRLIGEVLKYAEDGANIMINNRWLERPPQTLDRENLIN